MYQPNGQKLPERIGRLDELAHNLWWSWYPGARDLFRAVDYPLWSISGHNPVKQLRNLGSDRLETLAADPTFVDLYDSVMSAFDSYMSADRDAWFTSTHGSQLPGPVAYFSMEFAVHVSLPMYAGGLGVLAGDVCKEASDLGLPMVGIGLLFSQGYFLQHIPDHGWQEENYLELDHEDAPVRPVFSPQGGRALTQVQIADRLVSVGAWRVQVGRVNVYLLTSDLDENSPQDRELTARLYTSALEVRIQQEILLGIGGVRVLGVLGIKPSVWHANEGHASFMTIERVREMVQKGTPFPDALQKVGDATVFTTHTPLRAGTDIFPIQLVEKHLSQYLDATGVDKEILLSLGRDNTGNQHFNMTALGLKMAGRRNGVSRLHGEVSRWLWHGLWPQVQQDQVPISHVTNGIHVPTWVAPELANLYERYLGENWLDRHDDTTLWERVLDIPDHKLWATHMLLKSKLISIMRERAQKSLDKGLTAKQMVAKGVFLDPEALTIAFARRYTEYKRPGLIFKDIERLRKIVKDAHRPVQIIFAGKSHPDDTPSKHLLQSVYSLLTDHQFEGRIAFVEGYDIHLAHYLVQGVDVWLNVPRRLQEASGTSGMKAALNGVLPLSVRDGWWLEGFNGANGWAIGDDLRYINHEEEDAADAGSLYSLLEEEVIPLYYNRSNGNVPISWISMVKEAIKSVVPTFCARRMMKDYIQRIYLPLTNAV